MFSLWMKLLFAGSTIAGFVFLLKSISKILAVYNNPASVEFSAKNATALIELKQACMYEIAVKRPYTLGLIPTNLSLQLISEDNSPIVINKNLNLFGQRKNMSGDRIVPVAEFEVQQSGKYIFNNQDTGKFKEKDKLTISPKTGARGFLLIFAILFSALLFIGGLVMTIISLIKA